MLYSWKMVLKRRRSTLQEYIHQTKVTSLEQLNIKLKAIGASAPTAEELTEMASLPKPSATSPEVWASFQQLALPKAQTATKKSTSTPETKNVKKRNSRKKQSSSGKKIRSSS
jgi:hypothetical protein